MKRVYKFFITLNRDAALDSLKNLFALVGLGSILADFSTMRYWFVLPALSLSFGIWYADYLRHEGVN